MLEARDMIRGKLFESEKSVLLKESETEKIIDSLAEGLVWDFLNTNLSDILHGGAAAGIKRDVKTKLDKVMGKDNKTILKAIGTLQKAYGNRLQKLQSLKTKIASKINKNKSISDSEKSEIIKALQDRIEDTSEMVRALDGEEVEISSEVQPKDNVQPNTPIKSEPEAPEAPETGETEPEAAEEPSAVRAEAADSILKQVSGLDREKIDKFKSRMRTILSKNGKRLVSAAMEKTSNIKETEMNEKMAIARGVATLAKVASKNISGALRRTPKLKKKYDKLPDDRKNRVNRIVMSAVIKSAKKSLGDEFFKKEEPKQDASPQEPQAADPIVPDDATIEPPETEPTVDEPIIPNDAKLEPIQQAPKKTEPKIDKDSTLPDDVKLEPVETSPEEPVASPETVDKPSPEEPEAKTTVRATKTLKDSSLDEAGKFLNEKGLLTKNASDMFNELNDENKKAVVNFAVRALDRITNKHLSEEALTPAELGLPDDFDLGNNHRGLIKALTTAISAKVRRVYNAQVRKSPPKKKEPEVKAPEKEPEVKKEPKPIDPNKKVAVKKKRVPKTKQAAKDQIKQDKQDAKTEPVAPEPKPEPEKKLSTPPPEPRVEPEPEKTQEPKQDVSFEDQMSNDLGQDLIDSINMTEDPVFIKKMKNLYRQMKDRSTKDSVIVNSIENALDKWYEKNEMLESAIHSAFFTEEEPEVSAKSSGGIPTTAKKALQKAKGTDWTSGLSSHIVDNDLQTIQKGDLVVYTDKAANEAISPAIASKLAKSIKGDEKTKSNPVEEFKKKIDTLNNQGKKYAVVKKVMTKNRLPIEVTIQPMVGVRTGRSPNKMSLKKNGKPITVGIDQIQDITVPVKSIPREIIEKLGIMGIIAVGAGVGAAVGVSKAAPQVADFLARQNQAQSRLTEGPTIQKDQ